MFELLERGVISIFLLSIGLACLTIFVNRRNLPVPDKRLKILAHVAAWSTVAIVGFVLLSGPLPKVADNYYFWMASWKFSIILITSICLLWYASGLQLGNDELSKSFSLAILFSAIISLLIVILMVVSGTYAIFTGHFMLAGLGTSSYFTLARAIIPTILLPWYALHTLSSDQAKILREYLLRVLVWGVFLFSIGSIAFSLLYRCLTAIV